jgi:hypothetical protein
MDVPATEAATDRSVGPAKIGALIRNPDSKFRLLSKIRTFVCARNPVPCIVANFRPTSNYVVLPPL